MNLETIAMSRRMVEEKGLEMLTNLIHSSGKIVKSADILNTIRLFWPQEKRIKPVWIPAGYSGHTPPDITEGIRRLLMDENKYITVDLDHDRYLPKTGYIKLIYANYPSGKSYLAGISFIQTYYKDLGTLGIPGILVDAGVFYFSEPLEVSIDTDRLKELGDPCFMRTSEHQIQNHFTNDPAHRLDATRELEFMTTHYDVLRG